MKNRVHYLFSQAVKQERISFLEKISKGYSNHSFKAVTDKGNVYKIRIGNNNDLISRSNELNILRNLNLEAIYYEKDTGDSVWNWIEGGNLLKEEVDREIVFKLVSLVKNIHSTSTKGVLNHDDLEFLNIECLDLRDFVLYRELVNKYKHESRVLSHNDVSLSNLIYEPESEKLSLIDYEWGRINHPYWDYGNFIKEVDLSQNLVIELAEIANLSIYKLYEFVTIATLYSIQLSFVFKEQTEGLKKYRSRLIKQLDKYKKCFWNK